MLLLELAQARLGQADAHGEGSGGGVKRGGDRGVEVAGGRGGSPGPRWMLSLPGWGRFCWDGRCLCVSWVTSMVMTFWNTTNEGGVGEGTLCKCPHGSESECSSSSLRLLVCIRAAVCNFWRAYGDSASYLSTYVMDVTFTRTHRFLLYCSKLGCANLRQNALLFPVTSPYNFSLHIPHFLLKRYKVTTYFSKLK